MRINLLGLCAALGLIPLSFSAAAPTSAPVNTRFSERVLRLDLGGLDMGSDDVVRFLNSTADELGPQLIGMPPILTLNSSARQITIQVTAFPDAQPRTRELADALIAKLRTWIESQASEHRDEQLRPLLELRDESMRHADDARSRAAALRNEIRQLTGRADITARTVTEALTKLEDERQQLELTLLSNQSRSKSIEKQIADQSGQIEQQVAADPILQELQKVVDARQNQVDFKKQQADKGVIGVDEMNAAVVALAESRAKLLQRKHDAMADAGAATLDSYNRELINLSIDRRENEQRLKYLQEHLPGMRDAMDRLDAFQRAQSDLSQAEDELHDADLRLRQAMIQLNSTRPRVSERFKTDRAEPPTTSGHPTTRQSSTVSP
jgi:hypothetical protein